MEPVQPDRLRVGWSVGLSALLFVSAVFSAWGHDRWGAVSNVVAALCCVATALMMNSTNPRWHTWAAWRRKPR
jgi:hypothetical protein